MAESRMVAENGKHERRLNGYKRIALRHKALRDNMQKAKWSGGKLMLTPDFIMQLEQDIAFLASEMMLLNGLVEVEPSVVVTP